MVVNKDAICPISWHTYRTLDHTYCIGIEREKQLSCMTLHDSVLLPSHLKRSSPTGPAEMPGGGFLFKSPSSFKLLFISKAYKHVKAMTRYLLNAFQSHFSDAQRKRRSGCCKYLRQVGWYAGLAFDQWTQMRRSCCLLLLPNPCTGISTDIWIDEYCHNLQAYASYNKQWQPTSLSRS